MEGSRISGNYTYKEGDFIGPKQTKFIKRLDNQNGIFECSFCHKKFIAGIYRVSNGITKSCGCYENNFKRDAHIKYKPGDRIGPDNILLLERLDKKKNGRPIGRFLCPICSKEFEAQIGLVAQGVTKSCGCKKKNNTDKKYVNQIYGDLKVVKRIKETSYNVPIYLCECIFCGRQYEKTSAALRNLQGVYCCNRCSSKGEDKIREILNDLGVMYQEQFSFPDCLNKEKKCHLRFDFFLPDYNCCIEYDGEQHFKSFHHFRGEEGYNKLVENDNIKNQYCSDNNINLIRIPYTDFEKINKEYLLERIF